jgi:5,10-methylenetetrahydromethanopterin reductase
MSIEGPSDFGIGVGLGTTEPDGLLRAARLGDKGGLSFVSVGDNPGHLLETYVSLTQLVGATERCRVGTSMTNPLARDPLVVASALSSLDLVAPGRVFLGIGTGRAGASASSATLRAFVIALRELWSQGHAEYKGKTYNLSWDARPVPIIIGASGPKALRIAGELGDGAIVETGVAPAAMQAARAAISDGAESAGRTIDDIELWWYLKSAIAETPEEARALGTAGLAASAALVLGRDPVARHVPPEFHDACVAARAGYDMSSHVSTSGDDPNRALISDPAFFEYLLDRYGCIGTPDEWRDRIADLRTRGVDRIFCAAVVPDREYFISTVADVLATVNS